MRTFISIDIPEDVKKEIIKIQEKLPEFDGKLIEKENLHLTLKFLGEIDEQTLKKVKKELEKIKIRRFETEINKIGFFDNRKSLHKQLIVWLHMSHVDELQKEVDEKLKDIFDRERRFMSHLTIARIKEIKNEKKFFSELDRIKIPLIKFDVTGFQLKKSKLGRGGPVYDTLESYNLN